MAYEISFKEESSQLWVVYSGDLTPDEIEEAWRDRLADAARFKQVRYIVADYSAASLKLFTHEDVVRASAWPKRAARINPNITLVALMPQDLEYGMSRMWATYADYEGNPWKYQHVRSTQEALEIISSLESDQSGGSGA